MANVRNGNTFYIDTVYGAAKDDLAVRQVKVTHAIVSNTGTGSGSITLSDASASPANKLLVAVPAGSTVELRLEKSPIVFPNGVRVAALSASIVASLVVMESST